MPARSGPKHLVPSSRSPVVVEPQAGHRVEADEGAQKGADQCHQVLEVGDGVGDDVCEYGHGRGAAVPDDEVSALLC